jgi:hypothetical protein
MGTIEVLTGTSDLDGCALPGLLPFLLFVEDVS